MSLTVTTRMYKVGELGDCFLITFKDGDQVSRVLIDCGSFRNKGTSITRMQKIAKHIKTTIGNTPIDVVVGTHQHNDHVSGFVHAENEFNGHIDQVWLSWLDDPSDSFARRMYNEQKNLVAQLTNIHEMAKDLNLDGSMYAIKDVLGFYAIKDDGSDPEIPAKGIAILKKIGKKPVKYLQPGNIVALPGFDQKQVKVYVLGPPRKKDLLFDKDPGKDESYDHSLALAVKSADNILSALSNRKGRLDHREEEQFPFNKYYKIKESKADTAIKKLYRNPKEKWRAIDDDWLDEADGLALYLDTYTNNSSLVLAFELVESGKVLLFAADAQTGNWVSWKDIKWDGVKTGFTTNTLLQNTVMYKVGHHGSHNATLVAGLEAMIHDELVAMIPVDKSDPNIKGTAAKAGGKKTTSGEAKKPKTWKMPAKNLFKRLKEKTGYRVLRMEDDFADQCKPTDPKATWKKLPFKPVIDKKDKLFIEYTVQG